MRRFLSIACATLIATALPVVALAQTSSNASVAALLSQLAALEQQIQAYASASSSAAAPAASNTATSPGSPTPQGLCPDLSRTLGVGSEGADVSGLQSFLGEEGLFKGIATGYFGNLTQAAVADWQIQNGIVSGGDAASTGLGVVGPRTRVAMEKACLPNQTGSSKECIPVFPPTTECPTSWQPVTDANGCTSYYKCTINLPTSSPTSSAPASLSTTTTSCPVVQKPLCPGTATPFQTSANGCVLSYQCSF